MTINKFSAKDLTNKSYFRLNLHDLYIINLNDFSDHCNSAGSHF